MVSFKISKVGTRYTPKPSPHRVQAGNPLTFSPAENGSCNPLGIGPQQGGGAAAGGGVDSTTKALDPASLVGKLQGPNYVEGGGATALSKKMQGERRR